MPEPRVLTDEELESYPPFGDDHEESLHATALHHRTRAEKAERERDELRAHTWLPTCQCDHPHGECLMCGCTLLAGCPACHRPWHRSHVSCVIFAVQVAEENAAKMRRAEQAARRMARLLMDQERRGPFDYDNVPGGLVPRRPEMEVVFTTLGLPCPCPRDRWNKEAALREPEKGEG